MSRYVDPFEQFRRKKEMEKLQNPVKKKRDREKTQKKDTFDGFHISSFFKNAKRRKPGEGL